MEFKHRKGRKELKQMIVEATENEERKDLQKKETQAVTGFVDKQTLFISVCVTQGMTNNSVQNFMVTPLVPREVLINTEMENTTEQVRL